MSAILAIIGVVILVGLFVAGWWMYGRGPRLSASAQMRIRGQWEKTLLRTDLHRRVLEGDAVLSLLLDELGFRGTTGEKLRKAHAYLPDIHGIWHAHKLRNRIAHEPGLELDSAKVAKAMACFEAAIDKYCR